MYGVYLFLFPLSGKKKTIDNTSRLISAKVGKIEKSFQKSIAKFSLTGCTWMLVSENNDDILYTFRNNEELLITTNGIVEKCQYELIIDSDTILITKNGITEHYSIFNAERNFLLLGKFSSDRIMVFANHTKYKDEVKFVVFQKAKELYNLE